MGNNKIVKTAAAVALGASVVATAAAPGAASAATTYKIKSGKLVNAKTGKVVKGFKTYKSVLYKNGKKYKGLRGGKFYIAGKLGSGKYQGVRYQKGVKFTGVSKADGKFYKNGVVGTGTYKNVKYKKGLPFTGVSTADKKYYVDGKVATGNKVVDGILYVDGVKATGKVLNEDTLYVNGVLPTEVTTYGEGEALKYYGTDGKLYTGKVTVDGKEVEVKDGVVVANKALAATATSKTKVIVTLPEAVDAATAENFKISDSVAVTAAALSEDKKSVELTISGAEFQKEYTVSATGLTAQGEAVEFTSTTFNTPAQNELYKVSLTSDKEVIKADGASQAKITFELKDAAGNLIKDKGVEVAFTSTFGKLAEQRVTVQNGKATVVFNSEALDADKIAQITATVVESKEDKDMIGLKAETSVILSPNPDSIDTTVGALATSGEAGSADRVTVYFNKDVNAADFLTETGAVDTDKLDAKVYSGVPNSLSTDGLTANEVVGLLPVPGNSKALQLLVKNPLVDNSNIVVDVNDKRGNVEAKNKINFKLTDARTPAVLSVKNDGLKTLVVEFSEAVLPKSLATDDALAADSLDNYSIDGKPLSEYGTTANPAKVDVQKYGKDGDKRHIVTITLGKNAAGKQNYLTAGAHSLQASNIGDWAAETDGRNNIINTQTLDFTVVADDSIPTATVEVQSPEQYLVSFNTTIGEIDPAKVASLFKLQQYDATTNQWVDTTNNEVVSVKLQDKDANKFLVETKTDWTEAHDTKNTFKNYYNYSYRLVADAGVVENASNGKTNAAIALPLQGAMLTADVTSPVISTIEEQKDASGKFNGTYVATMSEPIQSATTGGPAVGANSAPGTPSQAQGSTTAIPTATAQFIKKDGSETVPATVSYNTAKESYDKVVYATPTKALSAGEWTLVVRSVSDDVGNTAASATKDFTVEGKVVETGFKVVWAKVDDNGDYAANTAGAANKTVFVKFNKPVAVSGKEANALDTANYTINGKTLPTGTKIIANIKNYDDRDNVTDSVTIILPEGTNLSADNAVVNVSNYIQSAKGDKLENGGEIKLPFNINADTTKVSTVEAQINALGFVDVKAPTAAEKAAVEAARTAYKALETAGSTADNKDLRPQVLNVSVLEAAEKIVKDAEKAADAKAAKEVSDKINALTSASDATAVAAARAAYTALNEAQKKLVTKATVDKLVAAEKALEETATATAKSALDTAIKAVKVTDYTDETAAQTLVDDATKVYNATTSTKADYEAAKTTLETEIAKLNKKA